MDKIFWVSSVITVLLLFTIIPAYFSTSTSLKGTEDSIKGASGYYNPDSDEIIVNAKNGTIYYKLLYAHEDCHRTQNYENRISYEFKGRFLNELECYIKQWKGLLNKVQTSPENTLNGIEIKFMNSSQAEENKLRSILDIIPEQYLAPIKSITLTKDKNACEEKGKNPCVGYNQDGNILVEIEPNIELTKRTLCHEILHSHFKNIKNTKDYSDPSHWVIDDLAKKGVCYDN